MAGTGTFTNDEYTDMVLLYGEAHENASQARRLYAQRFPKRRLPSLSVFRRTVMRLKIDGTFEVHQVRQRPVCDNEATVQQVNEYFQENPTHSQRRAACELGVKRASIKTILEEQSSDPHQTKPKRPPIDLERLVSYCRKIVESQPSIKVKSDICCKGVVDSETKNPQFVKVESDCSGKVDNDQDTPQYVATGSKCGRTVVDSEPENPQFVKVERLE